MNNRVGDVIMDNVPASKKEKTKSIFAYSDYLDDEDCKNLLKYSISFRKSLALHELKYIFIFSIVFGLLFKSLFIFLIMLVFIGIPILITDVKLSDKRVDKIYNLMKEKKAEKSEYKVIFYEDRLVALKKTLLEKNKFKTVKVEQEFKKIVNIEETDTHIYINTAKEIVSICKSKCDKYLIEYIRKISENYTCTSKNNKIFHEKKKISLLLNVLFIISVLSLFIGFAIKLIINYKTDGIIILSSPQSAWVYLLFLPFQVLSITLGIIYKKLDYKCKKNIVWGIISFILLITPLFPIDNTKEYERQIKQYKDILGIDVPKYGKVKEIENYYDMESGKTNYKIVNVYYENIDTHIIEKSIIDNTNWNLKRAIDENLIQLFPTHLLNDKDSYYAIYNVTSREYNTPPTENKRNLIYIMRYNFHYKKLEIHKFLYYMNN